jgi:F-type H+-transporting ATPase subunit gamma
MMTMGSRGSAAMEFGGAFTPLGSARAVSSQILRMRMKSVTSIQKITKAMKMVAASKLRGVQVKAENSRGMWQPFTALLGDKPDVSVKKKVIVVVSSDKGLCGGINSTSVKYTRAMTKINGLQGADKELKYVVIGEKAKAQLLRDSKKDITLFIGETQKLSICFSQVALIADDILRTNKADAYHVVFNKFGSVVSFLPTVATILSPETLTAAPPGETAKAGDMDSYEVEGADMPAEALDNLLEFQFASLLYNAMLENATSESGARMSAMDNSSRNATEMLGKLALTYNRGRQTSITTELIEIISGAAALEG